MKFLSRFKRKNQFELPDESESAPVVPGDSTNVISSRGDYAKPAGADEICLSLGDFLHRIPAHLLQAGPHDLQKEVRFAINSLSERIKRGETTINLAEIYRQMPEIFRAEVRDADKQQILYPWRKVISMIKEARPEEGGATDAVAENLAEKIRQKKPIIRGAGTGAMPATPQTPILRGRLKQQAPWFGRTTFEKGPEKGDATPDGERPTSEREPVVANKLPETTPAIPPTGDTVATSAPAPQPEPAPAPTATPSAKKMPLNAVQLDQSAPTAPAESPLIVRVSETIEAPRSAQADAILSELPPDLERRVAVIKGDYERQLADLELARKTYAEEVERLQAELNRTADRLDEECTANAVSRELLQQTAKDRDATREQITDLQSKMDALQKDSRLSAVTAERDALLQQKAHLSSQISELSKRGASAQPRGGDSSGNSAVLQRQVEEFQRRIALMESAQRDTALELAREKETRAKSEKLLAAAEKLQEQSANYMETAKAEIRKEVEASVKPREIEARKVQKDLQDQITQVTDQNRKLTAELENARAAAANPGTNSVPGADTIQTQAITQLEEDIENYRERLKTLLKERDAARAEARNVAANASDSREAEELRASRARLEKEFEVLRKEYADQGAKMEALRQERAETESRHAADRAALESKLDALRQSLETAQDAHASQLATLEATEQQTKSGTLAENEATADLWRQAAEGVAAAKATNDELVELRRRFNEQADRHEELAAELERERAKSAAERETFAARLREESHSLEQQLNKAVQERDELARRHVELQNSGQKERATHDELLANLERDHTSIVRAKEELSQRLAEAERALSAADRGGSTARLEGELAAARQRESKLEAEFAQERQAILAQHASEIIGRDEELKRFSDEREQAASGRATILHELEAARREHEELTTAVDEERRKFTNQKTDLENQVAASAKAATQVVEQSDAELTELRAQLDTAKQAQAEAQQRAMMLEGQLAGARADQGTSMQLEQLTQRLESAQESAGAALLDAKRRHEEESSNARWEINTLQTERDNLAQQRDELLRRLSRITDEHKRLLEDLTTTPQVMPPPRMVDERPPENVIEVHIPEVLPPESGNGIAIPRVRAVSVPPPKVHTL